MLHGNFCGEFVHSRGFREKFVIEDPGVEFSALVDVASRLVQRCVLSNPAIWPKHRRVAVNPMLKVLIAEDDLMIADAAEEALLEWGYEVCGIARTVNEAVALGRLTSPILPSSTCGSRTAVPAPKFPRD